MIVLVPGQIPIQETEVETYGFPPRESLSVDLSGHGPSYRDTMALREALTPEVSTAKSLEEMLPEVFIPVQEWEGYIVEIGSVDFVGRLLDITCGDKIEKEEAVIPLDNLSKEDAATIALGRVFRLVIGHTVAEGGKKTNVTRVVFRDLPRITDEDWEEGGKWADEVLRAFET